MNFARHSTNPASETARHLPLTSEAPAGVLQSTETTRLSRPLTDREKQTLRLVCDGLSNATIANQLGVSHETTKTVLKRIFRKIDVKNRTQAAVLIVRLGLV